MARMLFIAAFEYQFYTRLCDSTDKTLAAIAAKTLKEVKYHLSHATDWIVRLGNGTGESYRRTQKAVNDLWAYTGELFEMDEVDSMLITMGIAPDLTTLRAEWYSHVTRVLADANVSVPEGAWMQTGSRNGVHTECLGHILTEMQYLQRAYPDAVW
jgi:ring-1,2-phenylacetyl-CoA epoxidase subunit PaaC